jgi:hypothetical protein
MYVSYFKDPEKTSSTVDKDGWHHTGGNRSSLKISPYSLLYLFFPLYRYWSMASKWNIENHRSKKTYFQTVSRWIHCSRKNRINLHQVTIHWTSFCPRWKLESKSSVILWEKQFNKSIIFLIFKIFKSCIVGIVGKWIPRVFLIHLRWTSFSSKTNHLCLNVIQFQTLMFSKHGQ